MTSSALQHLRGLGATCPPIDKLTAPEPPIPTIQFLGITCQDTSKYERSSLMAKCASYKFKLSFEQFAAEAKPAPGGNLYWRKRVDVDLNNATIKAAFWYAAYQSKRHFASYFGKGKSHGKMLMRDVLTKYSKELKQKYGALSIELPPKPNETAADFVKRGGYLIWVDGWGGGVFGSKDDLGARLDVKRPSWMPKDVNNFQFYLDEYDVATKRITFVVRLEQQDHNFGWVVGKIMEGGNYVLRQTCKLVNRDEVKAAEGYAASLLAEKNPDPASRAFAAAFIAGWQYYAKGCSSAFNPVPCTPAATPTAPPPPPPVIVAPPPVTYTPEIPPERWFETPKGKIGIAVGASLAFGSVLLLLVNRG